MYCLSWTMCRMRWKKIENEQEKAKTDPVMMQMFGGAGDGKSGVLEEPGKGSKET